MTVTNIFQMESALILATLGIVSGIIYDILHPNIAIFKHKAYTIVCDIVCTILSSIALLIGINLVTLGRYRLYLIVAFVLGYYIERKTMGKLFAKIYRFVYNLLSKVVNFVCKTNIYKTITK